MCVLTLRPRQRYQFNADLYNPDVVHAWRPEVEGYQARTDRAIRFEDVSIQE